MEGKAILTHPFFSPNRILFGFDAAEDVAAEVKQLDGKKVLIVTDPGVVEAGLVDAITIPLDSEGIPFSLYDQVEPEPPARIVEQCAQYLKNEECDLIIGVGGGSSLDLAKAASIMGTNEGSILNFCGVDLVPKRGLPKILIPTTAGTGSEVTRSLVVTDEASKLKRPVISTHALSDVAIVDPMMTVSMPPKITADTGMDALAHAIESYVSVNATPFSDILAIEAITLIAENLAMAFAKGENIEARYQMSLAATISGLAFASGGLGAAHALSNPLGIEYHLPHGRANAIVLPYVMTFNLIGNPAKFALISEAMGEEVEGLPLMEAASLAVEAVKELLDQLKIPIRLRDYGISKKDIPKLVAGAMKASRHFVPNPRNLTKKDVGEIYLMAW
ncbi:MAG: iron-containing alcohol dehydrogenase [Deltaproteobacteria bacterium]|nr:iron-containing alcohol dehydrogenase [Deltaproteobacteria bacterium]